MTSIQEKEDLYEDIEELKILFEDYFKKLLQFRTDLFKSKKYITPDNLEFINGQLERLIKVVMNYREEIKVILKTSNNTEKLRSEKYKYQDLLRSVSGLCGNLIALTDWQSPSYSYSLESKAGRQTGQISGTINDYKRDVHLDEKKYEELFLKENIDANFKFFLKAYLVNSGQAAFQTILTYLLSSQKITGKILAGSESYFQYKQILKGTFAERLIFADEKDTDEIMKRIEDCNPDAIFLDSLTNSPNLVQPNLSKIIEFLNNKAKNEVYLVIDNSCLTIACQPFLIPKRIKKVHLISFESLNKFHQFGMDKVTAGIIICENRDASGIFEYRKHAGTNITDSSVHILPTPNRKILTRRLKRHFRNALLLADHLREIINNESSLKIGKIIYPGKGSFLNIKLKAKYDTPGNINKLISIIIKEAKKKNINIIGGTSFGLNTTRIYLTSLWSKISQPFLRVALGSEDFDELDKIKNVFGEAIRKF